MSDSKRIPPSEWIPEIPFDFEFMDDDRPPVTYGKVEDITDPAERAAAEQHQAEAASGRAEARK